MNPPETATAAPTELDPKHAEREAIKDINSDYKTKFGFNDPETGYVYKAPKGLSPPARRGHLRVQERAAVDARLPAQGARPLPRPPRAAVGRRSGPDRLRQHPLLRARLREGRDELGRRPRGHQEHLRQARHPRGGAAVPRRRRRPVRVRGRLPPGQREARGPGRPVHRHGHGAARARGRHPRALRHGDPGQRQHARRAQLGGLVGRLLRLRAEGRQGRDAAAGLLPDQHREHGPVRAHADHRRRGLRRALHRGLHGAGLLDRLAALRRGRADRPSRRPDPLHDRPELVAERLQPGHQAGDRRRGRDGRVGRLQPRLEGDDEVPVDLPDGRARPRRDPLDRLRRQGPAPGRRRQDHPRRAEDDQLDLRQVDLQGRRPQRPTAACSRSPRARPRSSRRSSATRCCSTPSRAPTPTRRSGSTRATPTSATRPRSRRSARSSSSTCSRAASTRKRPRR